MYLIEGNLYTISIRIKISEELQRTNNFLNGYYNRLRDIS